MSDEEREISREEQDFFHAQTYHKQLLQEIITLFQIYCGMCGEHSKETEPALARAIFFTIFGSFEASCRVIASSVLLLDFMDRSEKIPSDKKKIVPLTESEKLFLRQEKEEISKSSWIPQQRTRFVAFQDALIGYPSIYARVLGVELSIDKSCAEWQEFIKLKSLRDIGAHGNTNELRLAPDSMRITYSDIKKLIECRKWYCQQLQNLPWIAELEAKNEIDFLNNLLEAGFSEKCRKTRGKRFAQQKGREGREDPLRP
jgi:hypothetical protein